MTRVLFFEKNTGIVQRILLLLLLFLGRILIWDLTDKPTKLSNPNKHLELSDNVIEPAHVLFESEWDAPPCHTAWISEHESK